ncbi:FRG domain-containing protein [Flavobacterium pallidum]|uniref:FRG domain-containing protein n=1 Tax=Flavobacterium pallidum TaxID=2172098 RepID=UPI0015E82BA7|nr:FRG domain-containing protein [Flavobacterium pallidum]
MSKLENFKIEKFEDLEKLHNELINIRTDLHFQYGFDVQPHYRGEQLYGRDILPGIFRPPFSNDVILENARAIETNGVNIFKERVIKKYGEKMLFNLTADTEHSENWNLLFQAQHAGVKTNLIDLSTSVHHSAFFACEPSDKHDEKDAQLWCLLVPSEFIYGYSTKYDKPCYTILNPFDLQESFICNVPTFMDNIDERTYQFRLFRQHGRLFTSSNKDLNIPLNKKEFWENMIIRVKISPEIKKVIFKQLTDSGISHNKLILEDDEEAENFIQLINEDMRKL